MATTAVSKDMARLGHAEAMSVASTEYARFVALIRSLAPADWSAPTDCPGWTVKDVVAHNLGNMAGNASLREMAHQMRAAMSRAKANGTDMVDELTAFQISERSSFTPAELCDAVERIAARAVAGRRRTPALLRRTVKISMPPPHNSMRLGFLVDQIYNRDMFMHRVDITRATGRVLEVDGAHEGRIVAEIVGDWADNHGKPFDLTLDGPAGGEFRRGSDGERLELDAVEFARIVSGRHDGREIRGLLATPVLY